MWLPQETVALFKTKERLPTQLWPIGMRNPLVKTFNKEAIQQSKSELTDYLEPQQLGMSVAGSHQLVHAIRMTLQADPEAVCLKIDFHNAHTSVSRLAVVDSLLAAPTLRHMAWHFASVLAPATALESRGKVLGEQAEGGTQGDPEKGAHFNFGIQEDVEVLDKRLAIMGGWPGSAMTIAML